MSTQTDVQPKRIDGTNESYTLNKGQIPSGRPFSVLESQKRLRERLLDRQFVSRCKEQLRAADPFPHLVIDDLFDEGLLHEILRELSSKDLAFFDIKNRNETISRHKFIDEFEYLTQTYFDLVHRSTFVNFLSEVTDVRPLVVDHALERGGIHASRDGGYFNFHLDFNRHRQTMLTNSMSVITYLNPDWREEWGGQLELWCTKRNAIAKSIEPRMGRTVVLMHGPGSYHGHTRPIATNGLAVRRSLASYYYTCKPTLLQKLPYRTTKFLKPGSQGSFAKSKLDSRSARQIFRGAFIRHTPRFVLNVLRHYSGRL